MEAADRDAQVVALDLPSLDVAVVRFVDVAINDLGDAYTLTRELGGGGMSRVFVATENSLGRTVVVKCCRLHHPYIVPLLSAGDAGGTPFFTMPYIKGEIPLDTLREARPSAHAHHRYVRAAQLEEWRKEYDTRRFESPIDWTAVTEADKRNLKRLKSLGVQILTGDPNGDPRFRHARRVGRARPTCRHDTTRGGRTGREVIDNTPNPNVST